MIENDPSVYISSGLADTIVSTSFHQPVFRESIFQENLLTPKSFEVVEHISLSSDLAYWIVGISLLFLSLMHLLFSKRITKSISAFFSFRKLEQMSEEGYLLMHPVQYFYMLFYVLLLAVFIQSFSPVIGAPLLVVNYGIYTLVLLLWVMAKVIFYFMSGILYSAKQMGRLLIAHLSTLFILSSYLLLPLLLSFLLYHQDWIGYLLLIILAILFVFRLFYSFLILRHRTKFSMYQIFLYLCALELAPVIIALKLVIQHVISF